ncbi:MAG: hypothetical protein HFJ04_10140 [Lachnospiraceae bacterium]|nr:hypothetical protein [Lachnospiraceae bacterium]
MRELLEKQEEIELQRSLVNMMIEDGNEIQDEEFIRANRKLDQLIEEYIELESRIDARNLEWIE